MEKVTVSLYKECDGSYSCCMDAHEGLGYGLKGEGASAAEAIADWYAHYEAMRMAWPEIGSGEFVEAEFHFVYDLPSLLSYYARLFTFPGLARITDVSAEQLLQYVSGYRHASPKTAEKIQNALRELGNELSQITLV